MCTRRVHMYNCVVVLVLRAAHIVCIVCSSRSRIYTVKRFYANRNMPFSPFGTDAHRTFIFSQTSMLSVSAIFFPFIPLSLSLSLSFSPSTTISLSVALFLRYSLSARIVNRLQTHVCTYLLAYTTCPHPNVCRWKETNKSIWIFYLCSSLVCTYIIMRVVLYGSSSSASSSTSKTIYRPSML